MNSRIHLLNADGRLSPFLDDIRKVAEHSLKIISGKIPVDGAHIVFYFDPSGAIPHLGICGHTPHPNLVLLSLDVNIRLTRIQVQQNQIVRGHPYLFA